MAVSAVKRGRDGKLRYARDGRSFVVRADGARYYVSDGAARDGRFYCTRDVRRFLKNEAMSGGAPGPAEPVAGESAVERLPIDPMKNILRRITDPRDLAALFMASRHMTAHAEPREWDMIAELPVPEFRQVVRRLSERDCLALREALGDIMWANPIEAQHPDPEIGEARMAAWTGAYNKIQIVAERLAAIRGASASGSRSPSPSRSRSGSRGA